MKEGIVNGANRKVDCSGCIIPLSAHTIMQTSLLSVRNIVGVKRVHAQYIEVQDTHWKKTKKILHSF